MAFDPDAYLAEGGGVKETPFDPDAYLGIQKPVGTSIGQEISQLPAALKQSFGQPLEAIGQTAQVAGFPAVATALKGAIQEPEGYVSAGQRFMEPQEGEFQIAGFAPQYAPRAIVEQTGQILGSIGSRIAGAATLGGLGALISPATGAAGVAAGQFAGPALFEAAQIVGPVALERAKNNGYTEPTDEDMAYAITTAAGSGLLNAFGAKYLPGGEKAVGSFSKRLAASFIGEGIPEGLQSLVQQVGETVETKKGIQVSPKQAVGEALIGGGAGAAATIASAPFTPEQIEEQKITERANKEAENLVIGNDNPQGKAVLANKQKLEQEIADTKQVLSAIESTDPVAQKLKLELKEKEAILAAAQGQVDSIVDSNEPVVEAEKQQIELAKAITEPAPEVVTPVSEVAPEVPAPVTEAITPPAEVAPAAPVAAPAAKAPTEPPVSMVGKEVIPGVTPVPVVEKAPAEPTVKESLTVAPVEEEPFGKLPTAEVETGISQRAKEAAIAEEREKIEAPIRRQESINQFLSEGATVKSRTNVVGRKKAAEGGGDITKTAYYLAHPDGKREIPLSKKEASDLKAPAITPAPVAETRAVAPAPEVAPAQRDATKPEQMTPEEWVSSGRKKGTQWASIYPAIQAGKPVNAELYNQVVFDVPEGYVKDGLLYRRINLDAPVEQMAPDEVIIKAIRESEKNKEAKKIFSSHIAAFFDPNGLELEGYAKNPELVGFVKKTIQPSLDILKQKFGETIRLYRAESQFPTRKAARTIFSWSSDPAIAKAHASGRKDFVVKSREIPINLIRWIGNESEKEFLISNLDLSILDKKPITSRIVNTYGITLPKGYVKQGDLYVYQPAVSETITPAEPEGISVGNRIKLGKSPQTYIVEEAIPQTEAEKANNEQFYSVKNERTGETQVVESKDLKPVKKMPIFKAIKDAVPTTDDKLVPARDIVKSVVDLFGEDFVGDYLTIIDDVNERAKAGYDIGNGTIYLNRAYLSTDDNIRDYIAHELGHYILGDPKMKAAFEEFWNSLPAKEKAKLERFVENVYNDQTGEVRLEEKQVYAFVARLKAGENRSAFQTLLDALKKWLNDKLGTKFKMTDRDAAAILAGAVERFKSGELIERPEGFGVRKAAAEREQIMGEKIGPLKKTPEGIIAETQSKLRERFDPTKVTDQNTTEAFRALGRLTGKDGAAFAQELNDIGRMVDESGAAAEVSMGAALFVNDLFEYAVRLAAQGDKKMLGIMMTNINKLPTGTEGRSDAGRALRAAREMKDTFLTMAKAEQDAFINYAAEFVYGPNPTKQQVDSIKIGYDAVEKVQEPTAKEVEEEIAEVGEKAGTDLVGRINDEFTKATEKGKAKRKTEIEELDSEYKKIQEQADKEIEKLAKIQSDTPSFDPTAARQTANDVRAIVANDLKQRPDMGRKAPWKSMLVAKLQEAGVEIAAAETLADIVWRQHEINNLSRELSSINKAVEKGPISEIIKAIKETPLEQQQNPNWRYEVMRDYLRKAGLSVAQAERIAKLMDISLQKRFTQAKEQAFTDAISKTAPWKAGDVRSKRAFQQVIQAIRAGALDPSRNMASDIAAMNGWTGFTADQYKNLLKNDAILANEDSKDIQKAEAYKSIQDIISKSKLPIRARDVIGQYYDAQALSGIPTLSVNSFSPIAFAMRNAIVQAGSGTIKGDAKAIGRAVTEFVDSIKSWANTVAFSFKNNVTVYSNVDYIVNDDNLLRLYRKGVDQFTKSKNAKERADGVKNMMIGMMDYVRRILNALDYGAIAALQNQNISKYAMAVMKRQKMNDKQANEMFGVMMKAKNDFYLQQIAIGTDKNKAGILADEFYISSWKEALSKAGVEKSDIQQAMDAALNDALSSVGRNRQSLDAFKEENTKMKDAGVSSMPALWLLESMANAANQSESQVLKLFSRVIYGFAIVPARVIRETAWLSPYGFVRFGYDWTAKKMGKTSPYAQSLGTDVQYSQRLAEATAGTVALLGLMALRSGSTDDPEDEDEFKIVFTGNGPQRKDDPQFYDSWYKAGNKPNSMIVSFGKTKFTLNMMRGFEAFTWPAMMLGALDDLEIRKKQKQQTKTPAQLEDAAIVAGFVFDAALRRGPYAFTTKSLFGTYGDIGVDGVAKGLTFPAKTLIPVLGTSLASNLSNFLNDPIDRRTLDGAVWSNIPFIGPAVAPKSLNAFGEPSLSTDLASKMFKLGVPIVYDIPTDRESIKLHELVLKQGGGPSIPTRNQLAQRLDRQPTNKEYEMFVREYGTILTKSMKKNYDRLFNAKPEFYSRAIERIGLRARDVAENKVRQAAKKP